MFSKLLATTRLFFNAPGKRGRTHADDLRPRRPYGRTEGAKRVVAVDVNGLPVAALVVPASAHENRASELMLAHLNRQGVTVRLKLVLVDRGVTASADPHARPLSPSGQVLREHHTSATGWLQVACIATTLRHLSRYNARASTAAVAA
ncbi:MAG TPA: transposase [Nocardioides sp.]|nr:transposase [Nocardioides sp.]